MIFDRYFPGNHGSSKCRAFRAIPCRGSQQGRSNYCYGCIQRQSGGTSGTGLADESGFRVYVNDDLVGVELGGALKNIIAVAAGIADGVGLGDNAKAALMTRGITEIARLGVAMGGHQETFAGLSGIGDLVVTCTSMHSRNRRFGILVGQGVPVQQALEQVGMVVEGYSCTKVAHDLAEKWESRCRSPVKPIRCCMREKARKMLFGI